MRRGLRLWGLVAIIGGSGVLHFVAPGFYRQIVPRAIGHAGEVVAISGAAEVACAAALAIPATRRLGAWATALLLVAVFPANLQMALDGGLKGAGFPANNAVAAWLRLPLQLPLIWLAVIVAREADA